MIEYISWKIHCTIFSKTKNREPLRRLLYTYEASHRNVFEIKADIKMAGGKPLLDKQTIGGTCTKTLYSTDS